MTTLTDLLDSLAEDTRESENGDTQLGDIVEAFEHRGFGALILAPALITLLPTGMIPGVPAVCGAAIILLAGQVPFGRSHPWLPKKLRHLAISHDRLEDSVERARPYAQCVDRWIKPRLRSLTDRAGQIGVALIAIVLSILLVPLELVPGAVAAPAAALVVLALALAVRDGVLLLIGLAAATGAIGLAAWLLL